MMPVRPQAQVPDAPWLSLRLRSLALALAWACLDLGPSHQTHGHGHGHGPVSCRTSKTSYKIFNDIVRRLKGSRAQGQATAATRACARLVPFSGNISFIKCE